MAEFIYARNFKELVAYQVAFDLSRRVFELSKAFPEDEKFSLTVRFEDRLGQLAHKLPKPGQSENMSGILSVS